MFTLGILIGLYGHTIFLLSLLGLLYSPIVVIFTLLFFGTAGYFYKKSLTQFRGMREGIGIITQNSLSCWLLVILSLQVIVNLVGVLGPEIGFDALWYHLALPKIWLMQGAIHHIPGGLLYYTDMPKFVELLYVGGLSFGSSIFPKLIHFGFGILTLGVLYKIARKYLSMSMSLLVLVVFYANLVVGWESISAYIDLGRTFFELLSVYTLLLWIGERDKKWFFYSALFIGLAITTKILALGSLVLLLCIIAATLWRRKEHITTIGKALGTYTLVALFLPLPWLLFAFVHTGNPLYPFFTHTYPVAIPWELLNPLYLIRSLWNLLLYSADPINPLYLMVLPLFGIFYKKWPHSLRILCFYVVGGFVFWYLTPQTGGGRFILPYLPLLSLLAVTGVLSLEAKKMKIFLFLIALCIAVSSIGYRAFANAKFIPVIVGRESTATFLTNHLNFSFGDFYDTDGYFAKHIKPTDTVLLYGFHNLYYVTFHFIDSSWVKKGDVFTYIAVQNGALPPRFRTWSRIYTNPTTHVALYSAGGIPWTY